MQSVRLSKLNLIYGPNSGGKSSIIQALLLLKQSRIDDYETMYLQAERPGKLIPRGEYVDLGSFSALIHKHELGRELGITLAYDGRGYTNRGSILAQLIRAEMTFAPGQSDVSANVSGLKYQLFQDGEVVFDSLDSQDWYRQPYRYRKTSFYRRHRRFLRQDRAEFGFLPYLYVPGLMPESAVDWREASSRKPLSNW